MSDVTARLDLPLIKPSQAQKHVTHNEALQVLDGLVQAALEDIEAEAPPAEPISGTLFALGAAPVGDWEDQGGTLAYRAGEGWIFINPEEGWQAWDKSAGEFKVYTSNAWTAITANYENLDGIGIGTTSDPVNRLSLSSDAALFNHAGAGHQVKINKANSSDTGSLLFQSGFTGYAEMGLTGDTAFSIKVSDDGATWFDAMRASAVTQRMEIDLPVVGDAVQQSAIDDTAGRLLTTGAAATVLKGGFESRVGVSGDPDALIITTGVALPAIPLGYMIRFRAVAENTGAATMDTDGLGPLPCHTISGDPLPPGYIRSDADTTAVFDGTHWTLDRVAEHGANANGDYVRYADGTQVAQDNITMTQTHSFRLAATLTFPAAFADPSRITIGTQFGNLTSSTANLQQLAPTRSYGFSATGCLIETRMIDGLSGLQAGDQVTARMTVFGIWY